MHRYELHAHTAEGDIYVGVGGAEIIRRYAAAGFSGAVITDHYFSLFFDWFREDLVGCDHHGIVARYLKGYYAAREEGERQGFTVLPGTEIQLPDTDNHYLVYGLEEADFYVLPLLCRLPNLDTLLDTLPPYALVVQAHPFRDRMTVCDPTRLFGIEGFNYGTNSFRNEMAKTYAAHFGKPLTSGSDFHGLGALGKGGIETPRVIRTPTDLTAVLRNGDYTLIEHPKEA